MKWTFSRYVISGTLSCSAGTSKKVTFFFTFFPFFLVSVFFCTFWGKIPENSQGFPRRKHEKTPENPRKSPKFPKSVRKCPGGKFSGNFGKFATHFAPKCPRRNNKKHKHKKNFLKFV